MAQSLMYLANGKYLHAFLWFVGTVVEVVIGFYVLQALQWPQAVKTGHRWRKRPMR